VNLAKLAPLELHKFLLDAIKADNIGNVTAALKAPAIDLKLRQSEALRVASELGNLPVVDLLLKDGRSDPAAMQNASVVMSSFFLSALLVLLLATYCLLKGIMARADGGSEAVTR